MDDPLPLARDVLDKQVIDVNGCKVGKVDGIVVALRTRRPPRVIALELDQVTAWRRISERLGDWLDRILKRLGPRSSEPARILFEHVVVTGIDVKVDIDGKRTRALAWENWLQDRVIAKIPGGRRGGSK